MVKKRQEKTLSHSIIREIIEHRFSELTPKNLEKWKKIRTKSLFY